MRQLLTSLGLFAGALAPAVTPQDSVCAQVTVQLSQKVILTKTVFVADLLIENGTDTDLADVRVDLDVTDAAGQSADLHFIGLGEQLANGDGVLPTGEAVALQWVVQALETAAPGPGSSSYAVAGEIRFEHGGVHTLVPLFPQDIEVVPEPRLELRYFLQQTVFSDDPFTFEVLEESEPFSLGLLVTNVGPGAAQDVTIVTSQPELVDNPQGLLLTLQVLGAEVGDQPAEPMLTVELGDVQALGGIAVVRWLLESSLQGEFCDMSIELAHLTGTGDESLSAIQSVEVWPLIHAVELLGAPTGGADDGLPDFLVSDPNRAFDCVGGPVQPTDDVPLAIHGSDGSIVPVDPVVITAGVQTGFVGGGRQNVGLLIDVPAAGWHLVRIPDPAVGQHDLAMVTRAAGPTDRLSLSVGGSGDVSNAWTTRRTVDLNGNGAIQPGEVEHLVHILDHHAVPGTYHYDLVFTPVVPAPLSSDVDVLSLGVGGNQRLRLAASERHAGSAYIVLGSLSGTVPGIAVGPWFAPLHLPLNPDAWFELLLGDPALQAALGTTGTLDASGSAVAQIVVPPHSPAALAGQVLHHAYVLFPQGGGAPSFVSNTVPLQLLP